MKNPEILRRRLHNQRLTGTPLEKPGEVVSWMGAVQAQEFAFAKWALALRMTPTADAALDRALADGTILRLHIMRPTWHFVTPADIHWMLALTAPRLQTLNGNYYRQLELDNAIFKRSRAVLTKTLRDGNHRTRVELAAALDRAGILTGGPLRMSYILMWAEQEGLVVSGPRRGKQFTYALLAERAPQPKPFDREEALATLAKRYFTSHGPATLKGFVWWSGLITADARAAIEMVKPALAHEVIDGQSHWRAEGALPPKTKSPVAFLLPIYDEYTITNNDRGPLLEHGNPATLQDGERGLFNHALVIDGFLTGMWRHTYEKGALVATLRTFAPLTEAEQRAVAAAAKRYEKFLGMPVTVRDGTKPNTAQRKQE